MDPDNGDPSSSGLPRVVHYDDVLERDDANGYADRDIVNDMDDDRSPVGSILTRTETNSRETLHLDRPRRSSGLGRSRRRSGAHRELLKLVVDEEIEAVKQTRRALHTALERLDGETRRAQEAERRALELAQRFKSVNDARLATQHDNFRLNEQLSLYKLQLENAQRELDRRQDMVRDLESQRDDAEQAAARARTTARQYREQQLTSKAREAGRRQGYEEGLRRGMEEAGLTGPSEGRRRAEGNAMLDVEDQDDALDEGEGRTPPLDDMSEMLHLPSPPQGGIPLARPSIATTMEEMNMSTQAPPAAYSGGAEGSRFREDIASPGRSTLSSLPIPPRPAPWPNPPPADGRFERPQVVRTASPGPHHPNYDIPPDGWIPSVGPDNTPFVPPPHELAPPPPVSPRTPMSPLPDIHSDGGGAADIPASLRPGVATHPPPPTSRDYAFSARQRSSPSSLADSLPSTAISSFDLLNSPRMAVRGRERLSAIPEVSTSMELSPGESRRRSTSVAPEALLYPVPSPLREGSYAGDDDLRRSASRTSRRDGDSNASSARRRPSRTPVDESVRDSIASVQEWLGRSAADEYSPTPSRSPYPAYPPAERVSSPFERPYSAASGGSSRHRKSRSMNPADMPGSSRSSEGHRRVASSGSVAISVQPPSGSEPSLSLSAVDSGRLTPSSTRRTLSAQPQPSQQWVPTEPNSPSVQRLPSMGTFGSVSDLPLGFVPVGPPTPTPTFPAAHMFPSAPRSSTPVVPPSPRHSRHGHSPYPADPGAVPVPPPEWAAPIPPPEWATPIPPPARTASRGSDARPPSALGSASGRSRTSSQPRYIPPPDADRPHTPGQAGAPYASPRASGARLSVGAHGRSLSMHAGSTPAAGARPLSGGGAGELRRVPSTGSIGSNRSGYAHYNKNEYLDAAYLASSEDLLGVQSPATMANTRQNATAFGMTMGGRGSPAVSYQSLGSNR